MIEPLPQGATIGILGGGQLGRMLSVAASRLGLKTHIFQPGANPPAGDVAAQVTTASYDNEDAIQDFAASVDVVTYEFENVPAEALDAIEALASIRPGRHALATSQDRLDEKAFLTGLGLKTAPYRDIDTVETLAGALSDFGGRGILKTRRLGYDGKGQVRLAEGDDLNSALASLKGAPAILEGFVDFDREVSVIAARGLDGRVSAFDPGENVHSDGILRTTTVPAALSSSQRTDAVLAAGQLLNALDYVGVVGIEFFVTRAGLIVNEFAPRVHNSGHWTQNGCAIDQFEQHIRAVSGWPLGDGRRHSDVRMENLIGDDMDRVPDLAASGAALHLYGKSERRDGRKMGHANILLDPAS
ncbi:MAG: 5-(carboxyamino)imidazole ribonucleotide synthase [Rhodobacteraceae bacterium]|nr:5-(carboxyamino)imidazole ribonucleotide synthase [Paracoccaceae bacterium]